MAASPVFALDHDALARNPRFADLGAALAEFSPIDSDESFNTYCHTACEIWRDHLRDAVGATTPRFAAMLEQIQRRSSEVIETGWGGVVITLHQHPRVEKFLVVREGGYLALEMHEQKDEHLEVQEGAGLVLWRKPNEQSLTVEILRAGSKYHLAPGMEHCLIGTENLLVFERSTDPKGMDQDLIFIYEPEHA